MARKSLRPHLNQIRSWVRQGRTDAWVAHQLEVPVQEIVEFKRHNDLTGDTDPAESRGFDEEIDMRAEDDARIAAELEAAAVAAEREQAEQEERERAERERKQQEDEDRKSAESAQGEPSTGSQRQASSGEDDTEGEDDSPRDGARRRRSRRGGRSRGRGSGRAGAELEGTFDHGEEGYGLWLDPAIQDDPIYAEHWAGHRPIKITVEEEQIVIRRIDEGS